jgi:hypothetical protein
MCGVIKYILDEILWCMIFADDIVLAGENLVEK